MGNETTKDLEVAILKYQANYELKSLRASLPWECDVLVVSKSGYATEYELKISRSDFKADFKKPKHKKFEKGHGGMIHRFWFVVPEGMVKPDEVPQYAGLMYVNKFGEVRPAKYPKILEATKVGDSAMRRLYRSMMYRFLSLNFKQSHGNLMF